MVWNLQCLSSSQPQSDLFFLNSEDTFSLFLGKCWECAYNFLLKKLRLWERLNGLPKVMQLRYHRNNGHRNPGWLWVWGHRSSHYTSPASGAYSHQSPYTRSSYSWSDLWAIEIPELFHVTFAPERGIILWRWLWIRLHFHLIDLRKN